jgi:light-independent protochlorophyllide reductase subunit B
MERHIAKRLALPCAVISAPIHVQDFPARYSPQMGFEGANVIFDTWVHPLMMGLEEHLLAMFREDSEFHDGAAPSHLNATSKKEARPEPVSVAAAPVLVADAAVSDAPAAEANGNPSWADDATKELKKIPFFVRGKARSNTERFARERGLTRITVGTLYDAKAHFGR